MIAIAITSFHTSLPAMIRGPAPIAAELWRWAWQVAPGA